MARRLHAVTALITQHLKSRFKYAGQAFSNLRISASANHRELADPLYLAFLQGEAILRLAFFEYLQQRHIKDPGSLISIWRQLIEDRRAIQQLVESSGLLDYFNFDRNSPCNDSYQQQCYTAYCILIFDADESKNAVLLQGLTKGIIIHFMPQLFPEQSRSTDTKALKHEVAKALALQWNIRPEIKESFVTNEDQVSFSLICKLPRCAPMTLFSV